RRDRFAEVDRAPAPDRDDAVASERGGFADVRRRHLAPAQRGVERQLELVPARAREEERRTHPELVAHLRDQGERSPANDHARRARAKSTNVCATRVSARPVERTSEISRAGSSPSTRATASVPASTSASIAAREMNVSPNPASTALRADSCR